MYEREPFERVKRALKYFGDVRLKRIRDKEKTEVLSERTNVTSSRPSEKEECVRCCTLKESVTSTNYIGERGRERESQRGP